MQTIDYASAPVGSAKFMKVSGVVAELIERGDSEDAWIFVSSLSHSIIKELGLKREKCPCGNPAHEPVLAVGFAPVGADGEADMDRAFFGEPEDAPDALGMDRREASALAQLITAKIAGDDKRSAEIWQRAVDDRYFPQLITLAANQAGATRRELLGRMGVN